MHKPWTDDEVEILNTRYKVEGPILLSNVLSRTKVAIQRKAYYLGLTHRNPGEMTISEIAQIRKLHEDGRHKSRQLSPEHHARRKKALVQYNTKRRAEKRQSGVCIRCNEPVLENSTSYCLKHWAAVCMGHTCRHYNESFGILLIQKLKQQNYRCALTGETLIPSFNCSVDHIVPKSKGGAVADLDNIRWVTVDANRSKGHLSDEEFVAFCKRVIEHQSHDQTSE